MAVIVERTLRHRKVGDVSSPKLNYLKRKARTSRLYDIKRLSQEIEEMGGMSAEDVEHVMKAIVRNLKRKLTDGDSVKMASECFIPPFIVWELRKPRIVW